MNTSEEPYPRLFLQLSIAYIILGSILIISQERGFTVLVLNQLHSSPLDYVFKYYTFFGSGWLLLITTIVLFLLSYKLSIMMIIISAAQGLVSLLFKVILFPNVKRPIAYFENINLTLVEGVQELQFRSFPSGHTMTVFGVATFCAMLSTKWWHHVFLFILAILIAISRIYLSLHFLIDTIAGSILGIAITIITFRMISNVEYFNKPNLDRGFLK